MTLGGILEDLENELDEYYGTLNEVRMGIHKKIPPKPVPLMLYEQTKELGLPLVDGGIMDQPHIWLLQIGVIKNRDSLWRNLIENATRTPAP